MKRNAFTLAEVLITLGIIGVVAAITMPTLIQKHQEQANIVKLKKLYSVISQGYIQAITDNESPDNWGITEENNADSALAFIEKLKPYFKIEKVCNSTEKDCFPKYTRLSGTVFNYIANNRASGILADGTPFWIYVSSKSCNFSASETDIKLKNICAEFKVDTNGFKKPNEYGKDIFSLYLTKNSVIPVGTVNENYSSFERLCNRNFGDVSSNGDGCAAWVIYNGNMDYLHCDDLSWNGKTKCK